MAQQNPAESIANCGALELPLGADVVRLLIATVLAMAVAGTRAMSRVPFSYWAENALELRLIIEDRLIDYDLDFVGRSLVVRHVSWSERDRKRVCPYCRSRSCRWSVHKRSRHRSSRIQLSFAERSTEGEGCRGEPTQSGYSLVDRKLHRCGGLRIIDRVRRRKCDG